MTLHKLIEIYMDLMAQNYETIIISQVVTDLMQVRSIGKPSAKKGNRKKVKHSI